MLIVAGLVALVAGFVKVVEWVNKVTGVFGILKMAFDAVADGARNVLHWLSFGLIDDAKAHAAIEHLKSMQAEQEKLSQKYKEAGDILEATGAKAADVAAARQKQINAEIAALDAKARLAENEEDKEKAIQELMAKRTEAYKGFLEGVNSIAEEMKNQGKSEDDILGYKKQQLLAQDNLLQAQIKELQGAQNLSDIDKARLAQMQLALTGIQNLEKQNTDAIIKNNEELAEKKKDQHPSHSMAARYFFLVQ